MSNAIKNPKKTTEERIPWCISDEHSRFEFYEDFNEWLEGEDADAIRDQYNLQKLSSPGKAFFAGDKAAYLEVFTEFRTRQKNEALSESYLTYLRGDKHWFYQNLKRFEQFIEIYWSGDVVPFIGAGVSATAGFPTWREHLIRQGITAGINEADLRASLNKGNYEEVINNIESLLSKEVFIQEIKDSFTGQANLSDLMIILSELFSSRIITTNYDNCIEQVFRMRFDKSIEILSHSNWSSGLSTTKTCLIKLHGNINNASKCILSKNQYDQAYGIGNVNMKLPLPRLLSYFYKTYPLLFIGCSLTNDRTMQVFKRVKDELGDRIRPQHFSIEQAPDTELEMVARNAFLLDHGITAIWFERGSYYQVENILNLLKNELRYRDGEDFKLENKVNKLNKNSFLEKIARSLQAIFDPLN